MFSYTESQRINTGRQSEIDIVKALSVVFMILVHTLEQVSPKHINMSDSAYFAIELLGSPFAAPVFMFAMGIGLVYSRKSTSALLFRRGLSLIGLGYLLNILSDVVPTLIYYQGNYTNDTVTFMIESFINADILGFAGMFFLFLALIKKINLKDYWLIVIWVILGLMQPILPDLENANYLVKGVTAIFWGSNEASHFPFILWMFYPMMGYFFGQFLMCAKNKSKFYITSAIIGSVGIIASAAIMRLLNISFADEILISIRYYHHGILFNLIYASIILAWLPICYAFSLFVPETVDKLFKRWSKNLNAIYCVHIVILGIVHYTPLNQCETSAPQIILISFIILVVSDALSYLYSEFLLKHKPKKV